MEISLHLQEHSCEPAAYSSPPPVLLHSLAQHRSSPSGLAQVAARVSTAPRHVSVACKPRERRGHRSRACETWRPRYFRRTVLNRLCASSFCLQEDKHEQRAPEIFGRHRLSPFKRRRLRRSMISTKVNVHIQTIML